MYLLTESSQESGGGKHSSDGNTVSCMGGCSGIISAQQSCQVETTAVPILQMRKLSTGWLRTLPKATRLQSRRVRIHAWAVCLLRGCPVPSDRMRHPLADRWEPQPRALMVSCV